MYMYRITFLSSAGGGVLFCGATYVLGSRNVNNCGGTYIVRADLIFFIGTSEFIM